MGFAICHLPFAVGAPSTHAVSLECAGIGGIRMPSRCKVDRCGWPRSRSLAKLLAKLRQRNLVRMRNHIVSIICLAWTRIVCVHAAEAAVPLVEKAKKHNHETQHSLRLHSPLARVAGGR